MESAAIALTVFAIWGIVGYALTSSLMPRRQAVSNLLLAPAVGMGTLELAAHIGLRFGSPVGPIAKPIVLAALLLAAIVLLVRRPPLPVRRVLPFALIFLAAIPLTGWPMLKWGGDWIANANEDMANYCLTATGYRDHGYRSLNRDAFFSGEDHTYEMWSHFTDSVGCRHGCDLSLAMTATVASLPAYSIFMPVNIAMHLAFISSVGFLLYRLAEGKLVALISCALMALSPLSTYGVVQQLIAQVGGLALLVAGTGLFCRPARRLTAYGCLKRGILGGIVAASLVLHYTESIPFLAVAFLLHVAIGFARGRRDFKQFVVASLSAAVLVLLIGNFLVANISFLLFQARSTRDPVHSVIFPQYLNLEGVARLWGLETLFEQAEVGRNSPLPVHRLVLAGGFCLLLSLGAGIALAWRRRPVGTMLLAMAGVAALLIRAHSAFGLFKLAMFAQPFIIGSIVLGWARMNPGRLKWVGLLCLVALVPLQFSTQRKYVSLSATGENSGVAPGATRELLMTQFWNGLQTPGCKRFVVPVNDEFSCKLLGGLGRGLTLCFPAKEQKLLAYPLDINEQMCPTWRDLPHVHLLTPHTGRQWYYPPKSESSVALLDPANPTAASKFGWDLPAWVDRPEPGDYLLEPPVRYSLFNRHQRSPDARGCRVVPLSELSNYLIWRPSSLAKAYNPVVGDLIGLSFLQTDPFYPQATLAASGQYLTFQVLKPDSKVRVSLSGTATFNPGERILPPVAAVGDQRVPLPLVGHGAARVVSEPLSLQTVGASNYLLLDLGRPVPPLKTTDSSVGQDLRQISLHLRDVSLLSEEEYATLVPPENVKEFPVGLAQRHLEFSGCVEEGSVGKHSWFRLSQPRTPAALVVRGRLLKTDPNSKDGNQLVVLWKGVEAGRKTIESDQFEFRIELPRGVGPGKLELNFSEAHLVPQFNCQMSAQLTFVGFDP